jgi:hypothetical protein
MINYESKDCTKSYPLAFDDVVLEPLMPDPVRVVVGALHEAVVVVSVHDADDVSDINRLEKIN